MIKRKVKKEEEELLRKKCFSFIFLHLAAAVGGLSCPYQGNSAVICIRGGLWRCIAPCEPLGELFGGSRLLSFLIFEKQQLF